METKQSIAATMIRDETNNVSNVIGSCKTDPEAWPDLIPISRPEPAPMEPADFPVLGDCAGREIPIGVKLGSLSRRDIEEIDAHIANGCRPIRSAGIGSTAGPIMSGRAAEIIEAVLLLQDLEKPVESSAVRWI